MQIAHMKYGVTIKLLWQTFDENSVVTNLDVQRVAPAAAKKPGESNRMAHQGMEGIPVFRMEKVYSPTENVLISLGLDAEALVRVYRAQTFFEFL
jgi:hypothetical protein